MRRVEIIESVVRVESALKKSGLTKIVRGLGDRESKESGKVLLQALRDYSLLAKDFGTAEKQIVEILKLQILGDTDFWIHAVTAPMEPPVIHTLYGALRFVDDYLSKFLKLLETDAIQAARETSDKPPTEREGLNVLSVIVIENSKQLSRPIRLINILESITLLYEANAILLNAPSESLSVIGCDSGSDKAFDFLGLANVMKNVKEVILSLWDRVVFFREKQMEVRIDLIRKSLPVVEHVSDLERQKKIDPEQAELLRRKLFEGCTKFMESGAIIPEFQDRAIHNPRVLMSPQPKLLTRRASDGGETEGSDGESKTGVAEDTLDTSGLEPEERDTLGRLLRKARQENKS